MATNIFNMADLWDSTGTTWAAIKMNVTIQGMGPGSRVMDLQVGGISQFSVDPINGILVGAAAGGPIGPGAVNATGYFINGVSIATSFQPLDADLTSLAAASATNAIYYRSAPNTWVPVTIGTGLQFTGGTLTTSAGGGPFQPLDGDLTSLANQTSVGQWMFRKADGIWAPVILGDGLVFDPSTGDLETTAAPGAGDVTAIDDPQPNELAIYVASTVIKGCIIGNGLVLTTVGPDVRLDVTSGGIAEPPNDGTLYGRQQVGGVGGWSQAVRLGGSTMTGLLTLSGPPTSGLHAATKDYVDAVNTTVTGKVAKAGDTMTGPLVLPGDPTTALQAATKQYVDAHTPAGGATVTVAATPPASPASGALWWDTNSGQMFIWYDDGTSAQWVIVVSGGGGGGGTGGFSTGDVKLSFKTVADTGWVFMNDGSIGDATSGATTRNNADTLALFNLFYNACADADVPIQTSAGAATTRGAQGTAAAAFGAHCRLVLPKALGRALAGAGAGAGLTSRALGAATGVESAGLTVPEMPSHGHGVNDPTHTHGASESSHVHGLNNGYAVITGLIIDSSAMGGGGGYSATPSGDSVTGVGNGAITVNGAFSGIGIQANGGGSPVSRMQPSLHLNVMVCL